jgi:hypothetical protein
MEYALIIIIIIIITTTTTTCYCTIACDVQFFSGISQLFFSTTQ